MNTYTSFNANTLQPLSVTFSLTRIHHTNPNSIIIVGVGMTVIICAYLLMTKEVTYLRLAFLAHLLPLPYSPAETVGYLFFDKNIIK